MAVPHLTPLHPTGVPSGSPTCAAAATKGDEYVMLRCRWEGGTPLVTLRWRDSAGRTLGDPAPSTAVLVLSTDGSLGGREFVCVAAHPLRAAAAECRLRLGKLDRPQCPHRATTAGRHVPADSVPPSRRVEVPELEAESEVAVLEGGEAQLACRQRGSSASLGATVAWYDPKEREVTPGLPKYRLEQGEAWVNLTVLDAEWPGDSGIYRCTATNAVGTASLPVRLRVDRESWDGWSGWAGGTKGVGWEHQAPPAGCHLAAGYPAPPNVTISKLRYTRARTEVRLEWRTQGAGNLTGFVVQRRQTKKPLRESPSPWETAAGDIEPHSRDRRLGGLDPAVLYAFRVLAVNHRTAGHPSEVQTPGEVGRGCCSVGAERGLSEEGQRFHPGGAEEPSASSRQKVSGTGSHLPVAFLGSAGPCCLLCSLCSLPAEPPFEAYPAVTGAAVAGMLVASAASLLAVHCIARHRETLPRECQGRGGSSGAAAPPLTPSPHSYLSPQGCTTCSSARECQNAPKSLCPTAAVPGHQRAPRVPAGLVQAPRNPWAQRRMLKQPPAGRRKQDQHRETHLSPARQHQHRESRLSPAQQQVLGRAER